VIRLVALDLDGTLIDSRILRISAGVREALERARRAGVALTMVTGRMFQAARPCARAIGIDGPIVCYQGGAIYRVDDGERLSHVPVPPGVGLRVFRRAKDNGVRVLGYLDDELYAEGDDEYTRLYTSIARVEAHIVPSLEELFSEVGSTKINCVLDLERAAGYVERLKEFLGPEAYVTRSNPEFVEVLSPDVDKGRALAVVARHYGVSLQETMAIGDSWNDLPLLQAAGLAVAMGTSPQEVREAAHEVVAGVADDGVAEAIDRFVLR
jgi:Cof subfamily protein (haloacid dehalogenase superfamily)